MTSKMRIGDTAELLGVTTATIRNWIKHIGSEYFSETASRTTGKRFAPSDIQQLETIKRLLADGLIYEDIPSHEDIKPAPQVVEILDDDHQDNYQDPQETGNALAVLQEQNEQIKILMDVTIKAKDETIQVLKDEIERLRRPWWKRLF